MATPITWQNVMGPSLADASRPLEAAQRTFSGMFGDLGNLLKDTEQRAEAGRNILKDRNRDTILDLYAGAKTPEQIAAAQAQAAALKSQFGDLIRSGDIRGVDEKRLVDVRNQMQQGWTFDNAQRDQNEFSSINSIKAKLASNDPAIRAQGEQEAAAAQVRDQAALVQAATDAQRGGARYGEEQLGWKRTDEMHKDTLIDRKHGRGIADRNASVNERQAASQEAQVSISRDNYGLNRDRFGLETIKAREGSEDRLIQQKADLASKLGKTAALSVRSHEGAAEIVSAVSKLPDNLKAMGAELAGKLHDADVSTADGLLSLARLQQTWLGSDSGDVTRAAEAAIKNSSKGNLQQKTASFQADQYLRQMEETDQRIKKLDQTYGQISAGRGPSENSMVPPKMRDKGWASGGFPIENFREAPDDRPPVGAPASTSNPFHTPASAPVDPLKQAETNLREAMAAAKGKGYYSPEVGKENRARDAFNKAKEQADAVTATAAKTTKQQTAQLAAANAKVTFNQAQAEGYIARGQKVPPALVKALETFVKERDTLTERYGAKQ